MYSNERVRDDLLVPDDPHKIIEREGDEQLDMDANPCAFQRPGTGE